MRLLWQRRRTDGHVLVLLSRGSHQAAILDARVPVRVRFAPSPTGELHLGGFRTALYNFLFARRHGGTFVLRVEDTDRTRLVPGAEQRLEQILAWTGVAPDESPSVGGDYGPYRQSERLQLYADVADRLMSSGHAYRCFCSERRLELLKKEAARTRQINRYDGKCRGLSWDESAARAAAGEPFTLRFAFSSQSQNSGVTPTTRCFKDMVLGPISSSFDEGDFIIVKSDRFPTYHLANVVDDHAMRISHVLRGSEWLVSTPKHLAIYDALGWTSPTFAHFPLLVNPDGSKLSKRSGEKAATVEYYRELGFWPQALCNYVTTSGGGFESCNSSNTLRSLEELVQSFSPERVSHHPGSLDEDKLRDYNRQVLNRRLENDKASLLEEVRGLLHQHVGAVSVCDDRILRYLDGLKDRLTSLHDLISNEEFRFLWSTPAPAAENVSELRDTDLSHFWDLSGRLQSSLQTSPSSEEVTRTLRTFCQERQLVFSSVMKLLRLALVGAPRGLPVGEAVVLLGRQESLDRLNHFLSQCRGREDHGS